MSIMNKTIFLGGGMFDPTFVPDFGTPQPVVQAFWVERQRLSDHITSLERTHNGRGLPSPTGSGG